MQTATDPERVLSFNNVWFNTKLDSKLNEGKRVFEFLTCHIEVYDSPNKAVAVFDVTLIVTFVRGLQVKHVHCCPVFVIHPSVAPGPGWYVFW